MRALSAGVLLLTLAGCDVLSPPVPAEVVNVPSDACVGATKLTCNNDKTFVKREWLTADCKLLPISGVRFNHCSASKIYRYSFPGRGTAEMQSYGALLAGAQESTTANYSKVLAGDVAGVVPIDEATLRANLQGGSDPGRVVGRMDEDFAYVTQQRMLTNGKVISHTGDTFVYAYDSGIDHCKAFLSYGPVVWPGNLRRWAGSASICNHAGREVDPDEIARLQSELVFH
jgi:hypothetical protein